MRGLLLGLLGAIELQKMLGLSIEKIPFWNGSNLLWENLEICKRKQ
jgi:hypothetical protein